MRVNFCSAFSARKAYSFTGDSNSQKPTYVNLQRLVHDTFIPMVKTDSGSDPVAAKTMVPSTQEQKDFANGLKTRLEKMGLTEVAIDEHHIVTATLEGNIGTPEETPIVGLIAHYDTSPDSPNKGVNPQFHDYKGGNIELLEGTVIPEKDLVKYVGQKIITSDGKTLLGADDKAGIAEILEAINIFLEHPDLKRPKIRLAFTPDEETAEGVKKFDIKAFGADFAYTVDGELPHQYSRETFNAFNPIVTITGKAAHTNYGKTNGLQNSIYALADLIKMLPENMRPETTEGREGFIHAHRLSGDFGKVEFTLLVRDFEQKGAEDKMALLGQIVKEVEKIHPKCSIEIKPNEEYHNMGPKIDELPEIVNYIRQGIKQAGMEPEELPIRGGTDGANLSLKNLLTPNIGTGANKFHQKGEFISTTDMQRVAAIIVNTITTIADDSKRLMPKLLKRRAYL